jgi:uncharacterized protein
MAPRTIETLQREDEAMQTDTEPSPVHTFIWKIASRCNLNCSYCFVYNKDDSGWKRQPRFPDEHTARAVAARMREHCDAHQKDEISVVFHGGEPLMGGLPLLERLVATVREAFVGSPVVVKFSVMSNGLLFSEDIGDFMLSSGLTIGVSLDGPPEVHDVYRLDRKGRPTSHELEKRLELLSGPYRPAWAGVLLVVDPATDPISTFDYIRQFDPPAIDTLLPFDNFDRRPKGKDDFEATPYGDWLIQLFDYWFHSHSHIRIRLLESVVNMCIGGRSYVESIGLDIHPDIVVVETGGDIEALDTLKATFEGATHMGLNVFDNSFDDAIAHPAYLQRFKGADGLCEKCRNCNVLRYCGGGYIVNRYSAERGFDNPSIYCRDLEKMIRHVHSTVGRSLSLTGSPSTARAV